MQIQTQCQCGAKFAFSKDQVGEAFRCSVCNQVFQVPPLGQKPILSQPPAPVGQPPQPIYAPPRRRGAGAGLIGCMMVFFVLFLAMAGVWVLALTAYRSSVAIGNSISELEQMAANTEAAQMPPRKELIKKFEKLGYEHIDMAPDDSTQEISGDRLYTCHVFESDVNSDSNLAIIAQSASLRGEIQGDVSFYGQLLTIEKDAVIHGDVNLGFAQVVSVNGSVKGQLKGDCKLLTGEERVEGGVVQEAKKVRKSDVSTKLTVESNNRPVEEKSFESSEATQSPKASSN